MMVWVAGLLLAGYHLAMVFTHTMIMIHRKHGRYGYILANWLCVALALYLMVTALK